MHAGQTAIGLESESSGSGRAIWTLRSNCLTWTTLELSPQRGPSTGPHWGACLATTPLPWATTAGTTPTPPTPRGSPTTPMPNWRVARAVESSIGGNRVQNETATGGWSSPARSRSRARCTIRTGTTGTTGDWSWTHHSRSPGRGWASSFLWD